MADPTVFHLVCNLIRGGTEGQCARVAMQLKQPVGVFFKEGFFLPAVERECGPVYEVPIRTIKHPRTLAEIWRLSRELRARKIDLLHCWDAEAVIFGSLAARWAGIPFVTSRRDLGQIYPQWKIRMMRWADRRAAAVVVNAQAIHDQLRQEGVRDEKIVCIPNILDLEEFDRLSAEPFDRLSDRYRWIAVVARLDPEKDIDTVIKAAARVKASHPEVRWAIAGDGVERRRLEEHAVMLNVRDVVSFLGDVISVPALLKHSHIGVLTPSRNEGLSNTILEYMAAGLPTVATDCGGNRELVTPETGHLVPIAAPDQVADRIQHLLNHPAESAHLGQNARSIITLNHRPDSIAAQFKALYTRTGTEK
jgi:glycosyltransferase involved in cell wall biosynthesis